VPHSRRRTTARFGYVNFPVDSTEFRNSKEGGMFVKLVVVDDRDYDDTPWTICCGADVYDHKTESLVGDDQVPVPSSVPLVVDPTPDQAKAWLEAEQTAHQKWEERHFPSLHDNSDATFGRFVSRPYRAAMLLGVTGWSGFNDKTDEYWHCRFEDLTEEGKALYRQIQALYEGCALHLLTFLDT